MKSVVGKLTKHYEEKMDIPSFYLLPNLTNFNLESKHLAKKQIEIGTSVRLADRHTHKQTNKHTYTERDTHTLQENITPPRVHGGIKPIR